MLAQGSFEAVQMHATRQAQRKGLATPALDMRLLLQEAAGLDEAALIKAAHEKIDAAAAKKFTALVAKRFNGVPVSRLLGRREFYGLSFGLNKDTLDPRPDSEVLVQEAVKKLSAHHAPRLLDLGTGSGCLLLAALSDLPNAKGLGVDISTGAVRQARINAALLGLRGRAFFRPSNWFSALHKRNENFDCILANPPYIVAQDFNRLAVEVREYDPKRALLAPKDKHVYAHIVQRAPDYLRPAGWLGCEVGAGQAAYVERAMTQNGFGHVQTHGDLAGIERVVFGQWAKK